ncbi:MAG: murein biosynthesis integral membrane protein MurJ [Micavibrio sp.]|nr:murein biosynthesis integral membrane protein MurJ [Micavibrio sp.]|tara:strand:+ start:2159 stop:3700 length:1542 start_codon:yes stop_codon:yes gene_type:complete
MSLIRAMSTVGGMTALSRVAGFARDILTAAILGAGPIADAFFVALKLPNFFRRVTAEGAFSVSFVPLYSETLDREGQAAANRFANNAFWIMMGVLSVFSALAIVCMPYVIMAIAPGFVGDAVRYDLGVELSRITFPYLLMMSLTALLGGVLNAHDRFAPFAFAPVLFNLSLILALLLSGFFETPGHALAYGVLCAGGAQFLMLFWCAVSGKVFRLEWRKPDMSPKIRKVFKLMGPGVVGAGVMHINLFADLILASFLAQGAISYLYYADRLNQLPLGIVGIAVGAALLPMLSKALSQGNEGQARDLFNRSLEYCLLLALPAALALFVVPDILIGTLFERGAFDAEDTAASSAVLMGYAVGLPAYIMIKLFSTVHWARQDTLTPVRISIIGTVCNIALSIVLIFQIGVAGISLATGVTAWLQLVLHLRALKTCSVVSFDARLRRNGVRVVLASVAMALSVYALGQVLPAVIDNRYAVLGVVVGGGMVVYGVLVCLSGIVNARLLKQALNGRGRK